jgi:delta 1-pyrroline-5-carboxylate dehydrogenase
MIDLSKDDAHQVTEPLRGRRMTMQMFIAGEPCDSASGETSEIRNPATGELVDTIPKATVEDTRRAIDAAHVAFPEWAATPAVQRAALMTPRSSASMCPRSPSC